MATLKTYNDGQWVERETVKFEREGNFVEPLTVLLYRNDSFIDLFENPFRHRGEGQEHIATYGYGTGVYGGK